MNELLEGTIARWVLIRGILEGDEAARRSVLVSADGAVVAVVAVGERGMHLKGLRGSSGSRRPRKGDQNYAALDVTQNIPGSIAPSRLRPDQSLNGLRALKPQF